MRPEASDLDDRLLHAARVDEMRLGRGGGGGDFAGAVLLLRHCLHPRQKGLGQRQMGGRRLETEWIFG